MNLIHKIGLTVLFAACASGLSADDCCCCGSEQNSQPLPFTLTEFIKAEKAAQAVMLSNLLQSWEFSNDEIARMLEVDVKDVAKAREYFGPLEVEALANNVVFEHEKRCSRQFHKDVVEPLVGLLVCVSAVIFVGALIYSRLHLMEENRRLKHELFEMDPSPENFELCYPPR